MLTSPPPGALKDAQGGVQGAKMLCRGCGAASAVLVVQAYPFTGAGLHSNCRFSIREAKMQIYNFYMGLLWFTWSGLTKAKPKHAKNPAPQNVQTIATATWL